MFNFKSPTAVSNKDMVRFDDLCDTLLNGPRADWKTVLLIRARAYQLVGDTYMANRCRAAAALQKDI